MFVTNTPWMSNAPGRLVSADAGAKQTFPASTRTCAWPILEVAQADVVAATHSNTQASLLTAR